MLAICHFDGELQQMLDTPHVAVIVDAKHLCVSSRGVEDRTSSTITAHYSGRFQEEAVRAEFLSHVYKH